jgi:predicted DNA-binding antitoxin AbrB/MazE fold protein
VAKKRKLHGSVKKLIKPVDPSEPEKAEIDIHEADDLYREIRIDNVVTNGDGGKDKLKQGEDVDIILEAPDKQNQKR